MKLIWLSGLSGLALIASGTAGLASPVQASPVDGAFATPVQYLQHDDDDDDYRARPRYGERYRYQQRYDRGRYYEERDRYRGRQYQRRYQDDDDDE